MGLALYFAFDPIKKTVDTVSKMHRVSGAVDRIEEILNVQSSVKEPLQPVPFTTCEGAIRFQNVSFSYTKNEMALRDITLDIPKNAFCALVGHSGSGKSTFVKLIPRFYDASSGQVSIDGNNVRDIQLRDLRNQIGIVSQHPLLFNDTIFNNILLGNPLATKEMVYEAAQHAFAHDFILEFNKGYETCVGELGNRLSGGQKQRIALARAFLKNAPILLLDEATAALDSQSEHFIQLAMERLTKGKTVVAIAHRLSTIKHADLIVLLDKGSIIGTGQHASLIRESKVYAELVQKQNLH
jgi:subfamily B ATP-binding cassette protein MsbA